MLKNNTFPVLISKIKILWNCSVGMYGGSRQYDVLIDNNLCSI